MIWKKNNFLTVLFAVLIFMAVMVPVGCGDDEDAGGIFTYAELGDAEAIDPALVNESVGANIVNYTFDGLVKYDSETGEVVPAMAESWEVSDDATEFTFKLREGAKFSNGREITAEDFVYSWNRALDPETQSPMALTILEPVQGAVPYGLGEADTLTGIEAVDDYTFKVTLEFPLAEFVTFLGHPVTAPVPSEEVERTDAQFSENPVGNGPYKLKEWKRDQELVLEKNNEYYGEDPMLDEVVMKVIPDPSTAVEELKAGNVDAVKVIPPGMDESLRSDEALNIYEGDVPVLQFAAFNMTESPWSDNATLRQAFSHAIDTETIANVVMMGQAAPADGLVPPGIPGHQDDALPYTYDLDAAVSRLAEAGYPNGEGLPPITLTYPSDGPFADVATAIQSQLKEAGIQVELNGLPFGDFLDQMGGQQLSFFIISWGADYPSPDTFLYTLFSSDSAQNVSLYSDEEADKLLDEARSTLDEQARLGVYNQAEDRILGDAPVIPIVFGRDVMAYSSRVTTFVRTTLGDLALDEITVSES